MTFPVLCPSSRAKPGAQLLGVRQRDGTVAILPHTLPVDETFMEAVAADPTPPEQRFRFTNKCIESGCQQWQGGSCGVINHIVTFLDKIPSQEPLPACSIRPQCRWFLQQGKDTCTMCPYVLTEITEAELETGLQAR